MVAPTASLVKGEPLSEFASSIGCTNGISGYMPHTVPCVIQAWLRHPRDYRTALMEILAAGGDADTTAAILGAIIGAGVGQAGIPAEWLDGLIEWPRNVSWMARLGESLCRSLTGDMATRAPPLSVPGVVMRNAVFTAVVLLHALRRLAPPY